MKKLTTVKTLVKKSFFNNRTIVFQNSKLCNGMVSLQKKEQVKKVFKISLC